MELTSSRVFAFVLLAGCCCALVAPKVLDPDQHLHAVRQSRNFLPPEEEEKHLGLLTEDQVYRIVRYCVTKYNGGGGDGVDSDEVADKRYVYERDAYDTDLCPFLFDKYTSTPTH